MTGDTASLCVLTLERLQARSSSKLCRHPSSASITCSYCNSSGRDCSAWQYDIFVVRKGFGHCSNITRTIRVAAAAAKFAAMLAAGRAFVVLTWQCNCCETSGADYDDATNMSSKHLIILVLQRWLCQYKRPVCTPPSVKD